MSESSIINNHYSIITHPSSLPILVAAVGAGRALAGAFDLGDIGTGLGQRLVLAD